jgi:hypothetical protein
METSVLYQKIHLLPLSKRQEVSDYVEFLLSNTKLPMHKKASAKKVTFNSVTLDTRGYKFNREEANAR